MLAHGHAPYRHGVRLDEFDYELPADRIAQTPIEPRDAARLLVDRGSAPPEHRTSPISPSCCGAGDLVVVNETKVIPARLRLRRATGERPRCCCSSRSTTDRRTWEALVRPARRLRAGETLLAAGGAPVRRSAGAPRPATRSASSCSAPTTRSRSSTSTARCRCRRTSARRLDRPDRYQTVYATSPGSAAAPTAGLHLTPELLERVGRGGRAGRQGRARRRARHVPAGDRARPARAPHAQRALPRPGGDVGGVPRRRARRRRRHDHRAGARERGGDRAAGRPDRAVHPPRLRRGRSSTCCSPTSTCPARRC